MIVLFTDFGNQGPYVGQMKAALLGIAPNAQIVDLLHDAPAFDPRTSSYLLAAYSMIDTFPKGTVFLSVVDPGVGGDRAGLMVNADGRWYVGPDNGLFEMIMRRSETVTAWRIGVSLDGVSATFHGRDVFAPAAAVLSEGRGPKDAAAGELLRQDQVMRFPWPDDLAEIIYVDGYGNLVTGLRASNVDKCANIHIESMEKRLISRAQTFSDVSPGAAFWYENSSGLLEIAVNGDHAGRCLGQDRGRRIWTTLDNVAS